MSDCRAQLLREALMSEIAALPQGQHYFCVSDHKV